jgi:hypothetical protein
MISDMQRMTGNMLFILLFMLVIVPVASGCAGEDPGNGAVVSFEQLMSSPGQYNGKEVTIEGFVFLGFETTVLCEELKYSGYAEGHLIPGERTLWIEGNIPADTYDGLYEQHMMGPSERYGKVIARGTFQYGERYGHLGSHRYQISLSEIQLLSWSP